MNTSGVRVTRRSFGKGLALSDDEQIQGLTQSGRKYPGVFTMQMITAVIKPFKLEECAKHWPNVA